MDGNILLLIRITKVRAINTFRLFYSVFYKNFNYLDHKNQVDARNIISFTPIKLST